MLGRTSSQLIKHHLNTTAPNSARLVRKLIAAIRNNDIAVVEALKISNPTLFFYRDSQKNTILHLLAEVGSINMIEIVCEHLHAFGKMEKIAGIVNIGTNTPLHVAAKHGRFDAIQLLIEKLGPFAITILRTTNDDGKLPLHCLTPNSVDYKKTELLLLKLTVDYSSKKISDIIDTQAILKKYPNAKNTIFSRNLKIGIESVNCARKNARKSTTHSQFNLHPQEEKNQLTNSILKQRKLPSRIIFYIKKITPQCQDQLEKFSSNMIESGLVNCHEISLMTAIYAIGLAKNLNLSIECISYDNADHVFTVIGRKKSPHDAPDGSKIAGPEHWGEDCVVCDGLTGEVFAARDFYSHCVAYFNYAFHSVHDSTEYNITAYPNKKFHTFSLGTEYKPERAPKKSLAKVDHSKILIEQLKKQNQPTNPAKLFANLCTAINLNDLKLIQQECTHNPFILTHKDCLGNTLLHYAIMSGKTQSVKLILDCLIKINKINDIAATNNCTSDTLLHLAAEFSTAEVISLLINNIGSCVKAMAQTRNARGKTPLELACTNPHVKQRLKIQELLSPTAKSESGLVPTLFCTLRSRCVPDKTHSLEKFSVAVLVG